MGGTDSNGWWGGIPCSNHWLLHLKSAQFTALQSCLLLLLLLLLWGSVLLTSVWQLRSSDV
jgi:hypothetical protein